MESETDFREQLSTTAFAFRGYNVTNLGKTPELLEHPLAGPIVERHLVEASELGTKLLGREVDLVTRVRQREKTTLESYSEAVCQICAVELAHIEILETHFDTKLADAKCATGYSLGEVGALIATGVYDLESLLTPILSFSDDCVELARNIRMGIVFSRGPTLDMDIVEQLCVEITMLGEGTVCISAILAPNTVLLLGQNGSLDLFKKRMKEMLPKQAHMKKNPDLWPPIHTQITRQKNIPDRASVMLETASGGITAPSIPVISCITGEPSYNEFNSRSILYDWIDHPQKLWSVMENLLKSDVTTIVHVGPEPNIIPATFKRLSMNVATQLNQKSLAGMGLRAVSSIVRGRPWLAQMVSKNASLLRAPLIEHVILEDWLLENLPESAASATDADS
jgi:[acyl-carrier-protein] S-malonyltransferase